ncbi:MAG: uroporphyrinogen decarboxylase family protein, partial [Oscillospiraceae bacterium]|nr:uroporphyrinogen decarboxylase family protein [Oscillospiraceae bacterium]
EYFRHYCNFFRDHGYDTVSFECCTGGILPGSGALGNPNHPPAIRDMADFKAYPWEGLCDRYFEVYGKYFRALRDSMPAGMKAIGGVGNGVFECVQDLVGYQNLCYIGADDEELYDALFNTLGDLLSQIWSRFMKEFGDIYCVLRFGDDLGYKSNSLLSTDDIRAHILPQYKKIIDIVHSHGKPFLLHSCGCIFNVMDDIIACGIDAKHSNEDQIARFPEWVSRYGGRIGNFGGIDVNVVCSASRAEMKEYITDVIRACQGHGGFAFGTGNSIPDYVPADSYLTMVEIVREYRGDFH